MGPINFEPNPYNGSFRLSVRPFVTCSFLSWFVLLFDLDNVSPVVYVSVTTYQKAFVFGP